MRIAVVGDVHGKTDLMLERVLQEKAEAIVQVGDFGTFASEDRMDGATKRHNGLGDFADYYYGKKKFPLPVYFVKGNHEDFDVIDEIKAGKVQNLHFMENGNMYEMGGLRFGALGGNYSPMRFSLDRSHPLLQGARRKHFNHQDLEDLREKKPEIIIAHDCPQGVYPLEGFGSMEVAKLVAEIQPKYYFYGHYHGHHESKIKNTRVICLGIIGGRTKDMFILEN